MPPRETSALGKSVGVWAMVEKPSFLLPRSACFLGGFEEDADHRGTSALPVARAWADRCVVAQAVDNLAAQGALRVLICFTSVENQALATVFLWNAQGSNESFGCAAFKSFCAVALQERESSVIFKQGAHSWRYHKTQRDQPSLYARQRDQAALEESKFPCGHVVDITRILAQNVGDRVLDRHAHKAIRQRSELRGDTDQCNSLYLSGSSAVR